MASQRLAIVRIPVINTSTYVAGVVALVFIITQLIHGAPLSMQDKPAFHFIGSASLGGLCIAVASWIVGFIAFAVYNKLAKRFGGIHFLVEITDGKAEQMHAAATSEAAREAASEASDA